MSHMEAASRFFKVATVQNVLNLMERKHEPVPDHCEKNGIGFIPWSPLAVGDLARPGSVPETLRSKYGVSADQLAFAWLVKQSPVIIPIPGTASDQHFAENVAAANISLSGEDFEMRGDAGAAKTAARG